ncbi:MAG: DUF5916 domain-containing protein [Gemmatimonadota bacterium]|nr:DUF5916 domain-containing protein [Gemmatimonadota bacterium]
MRRLRMRLGLSAFVLLAPSLAAPVGGQEPVRYQVQIAVRERSDDAVAEARRAHELLDGELPVVVEPWGHRHRVRVGDFDTREGARPSLQRIWRLGYEDAWLAPAEPTRPTLSLAAATTGSAGPRVETPQTSDDAPGTTGVAPHPDADTAVATVDDGASAIDGRADGRGAFEGHHEASDCRRTAGWVWDRTDPDTPLSIEVFDNGEPIGSAVADVFRSGLLEREKGNGSHAFHFEHPEALWDGRVHEISVRVGGQPVLLMASPRRIACTTDGEPMDEGTVRIAPKSSRASQRGGPVSVDGRLDEAAWARATFVDDFLQKGHDQGYRSRVRTSVAFLYDEEALYVGARLESPPDRPPSQIRGRDDPGSDDRLLVSLDTFHDLQTAYTFGITEGGTRLDHYHPSDQELPADRTFDPVWEARTARDSAGWTAELRIPFSQLRFPDEGRQVWGLNIKREDPSRFVSLYWVVVPTYERGWSSRFGELVGVETGGVGRRVEVMPYVLGSTHALDRAAGGAGGFRDGEMRVGADLKLGLGPNLTMDATFNPDFGQIEADPAEVNLSAFETFFPERRPFFQEGSQLLRGAGPDYFYSRRIGSLPRGVSATSSASSPDGVTILGAGKLTGRLESGLSVGGLAAVTQAETLPIVEPGADTLPRVPISPTTGFGVARVQKEIGRAGSTAGFMLTGLQRDLDPTLAPLLPRTAVSGGGDWNVRLGSGTYAVQGHAGFSHVAGDSSAIYRLQRSSVRYFQRPDAEHVSLDPSATSLTGYTAGLSLAKVAGAPWLWELSGRTTTPGLELNDVGILQRADEHGVAGSVTHRRLGLGGAARQFSVGAFADAGWNHGGVRRSTSFGLFGHSVWRNFWRTYAQAQLHTAATSDDLTRGGPLMGTPRGVSFDVGLSGSHAEPTQWGLDASTFFDAFGGWSTTVGATLSLRPDPRLDISISPGLTLADQSRQYFDAIPGGPATTYGQRYVFSRLDRSEIYTQIRVGYAITPDLTLELYGEPFASSARYHEHGELTGAGESSLRIYGTDGTTTETLPDGSVLVTDGEDEFTLWNSDFNVRSFRTNLVLRWDWPRGSSIYLIWQQNRWYWDTLGDHVSAGSLARAVGDPGEHILVAKVSYWLNFR